MQTSFQIKMSSKTIQTLANYTYAFINDRYHLDVQCMRNVLHVRNVLHYLIFYSENFDRLFTNKPQNIYT